jgi:hypothetical protein
MASGFVLLAASLGISSLLVRALPVVEVGLATLLPFLESPLAQFVHEVGF